MDRCSISFGIDFSGSTNLRLLPSIATRNDTTNEEIAAGAEAENDQEVEVTSEGERATVKLDGDQNTASHGGSGEPQLSARVSAEPFCRTLVTRVTVRDPECGGVMKVCTQKPRVGNAPAISCIGNVSLLRARLFSARRLDK